MTRVCRSSPHLVARAALSSSLPTLPLPFSLLLWQLILRYGSWHLAGLHHPRYQTNHHLLGEQRQAVWTLAHSQVVGLEAVWTLAHSQVVGLEVA